MGGKKGPEINRKYEKDRRDRFNDQFVELHKLLPDFSSASAKATKTEIISKTIQYLKESPTQTRKLEIEFENEKRKVNELQKKVNGVLQIVKELIKLLHKSNIKFPSSLPINDFKIFQDVFSKKKKKLISVSAEENKINDADSDCAAFTDSESEEKSTSSNLPADAPPKSQSLETVSAANNAVPCTSIQTNTNSPDASSTETKVVNLNSDALILPTGNLFAVNGAPNNILNCYNSTPPLLLNKQFAVPTLILMQNNFVPVNAVQHIAVTQQTQKLLLPKQTTKTTFINKKPIPSVRLFKASSTGNNGVRKVGIPRRRHSRRSKGILVKYPKRKPPTKNKKRELHTKKCTKPNEEVGKSENTEKDDTFTAPGGSFADTSINKTYQCADRMLNIPEIPTTGFIDFLENTASRCMENTASNTEFEQSNELLKGEKSQMNFVANTFEPSFSNTDLGCALIETHKKDGKSAEASQPKLYETPSTSDLYMAGAEKNFTAESTAVSENMAMEKPKSLGKEIRSKDLNLSFDDKKHYEGFDEFSNDLFTSLQVPPSAHNADSISPTAAFLQTFPLVSSGANVDLLPEHEESTTTASATILQIGNLESPSMLFATKGNREAKETTENFVYTSGLENTPKDKKCKETTQPALNFDATFNMKAPCKDASQFYPTTTTTFSSYNIFTKYNDFPPPATSYYSLCSQPFTSKTTDSDFSWMSYTPDESKDKSKQDKCVNTFKTVQEIESFAEAPSKSKKAKQSNARPLVNWMTTPDLRNAEVPTDTYLPKDDTSMYQCNSSNNYNYSSSDYFVENQNYSESSCKLSYTPSNPCNSWSSKATNVVIPSTLPTLVGDLALGNTFNNYESTKKFEPEKKKACRNYCKGVNTPSSFLSVTQLVDDKSLDKAKKMEMPACGFGEEQEKWNQRNNEEYSKKTYPNVVKDTKMKCKKDAIKYQAPRCASKENKKFTRNYSMQNCQMQKEVNPLSSKNSNYSAESLISSSNQNCSTGYFPYENSSNYSCSNEYSKKRGDESESLANVGYYGNSNYMYHNNFQSFNNYGFSNQCYNNYSSQIQPSGFQKKKDDGCNTSAEWSLPSYNPIVQSDYGGNQKVDPKCKQSFPNKCNHAQKNNVGSEMYNKYLQATPATSTVTQLKSNCTFNTSCSFNQSAGQACMETNYLAPNYEMKSNRQANGMNTVHSATTLTNFNLSTIFPEINDKHCSTNQVNATNNAKSDPKYSKNNVDETNYNYFLQPAAENNTDHFYGSSSFQIHNFTDFTSRKALK